MTATACHCPLCSGGAVDGALAEAWRNVEGGARQHIWYVSDVSPPFAYTVGRTHHGLGAEWVVFGLPPEPAASLLNQLTAQQIPAEEGLVEIGGGRAVILSLVHPFWLDLFDAGRWMMGEEFGPVVQVAWPDLAGRYPGHPRYDAARFPQLRSWAPPRQDG